VLVNVARGLPLLRELLQLPAQRNPRGDDEGMPLLGRLRRRLGPLGALGLQTRAGQKRSISYHYDREAEFFRTFLGESMVYSAGAFLADDGDLDQAQRRKLDLICRKLELRPDTRLLDIGCGWGSLLVHAATNYGVAGTGVTLSREQADYARRWAERVGVGHRVTVHVGDYRDFCRDPGNARAFDAIASVGMLAHIGEHEKASYFGGARRVLAPGGAFLCHGITTRRRPRLRGPRKPMFVRTWMFPDGHLDHLETVIEAAEWAGFELRDAESLAECYSVTLRNWCTNLERNREAALAIASERDYRMWRYFHALCSVGFSRPAAELTVHQLLLTDPHRPWHFGRRHCLAEDDR
jgi:cyclopropane-fatty-acyl-phospholipid synthase